MEDSFSGIYLSNYKFDSYIRGDSRCAVFSAVHLKTGLKVAIKTFLLSELRASFLDFLQTSLSHYQEIASVNVLKILEFFRTETHGFLVLEFCEDKSLEDYWLSKQKLIKEKKLIKIIRQIFNGFKALHEKKLAFRDYKLKNILIHRDKIKVGDAANFMKKTSFLFQSQREYLAPEVLKEGDSVESAEKADLWAIGVSIYKLVYGKPPFQGVTDLLLLRNIEDFFMKKRELDYKRENLVFCELFKNLIISIFRPVEERDVEKVFEEELLTKKFSNKDFEDSTEETSDFHEKTTSSFSKELDFSSKSTSVERFLTDLSGLWTTFSSKNAKSEKKWEKEEKNEIKEDKEEYKESVVERYQQGKVNVDVKTKKENVKKDKKIKVKKGLLCSNCG